MFQLEADAGFEVFTVVKISTEVFWIVTLCSSVLVGYHRFRGSCCFHLQQYESPKHLYRTITLHGVTHQKTPTLMSLWHTLIFFYMTHFS